MLQLYCGNQKKGRFDVAKKKETNPPFEAENLQLSVC